MVHPQNCKSKAVVGDAEELTASKSLHLLPVGANHGVFESVLGFQ